MGETDTRTRGAGGGSRARARWFGWGRQTTLFAVALSLFVHMALILGAALYLLEPPDPGGLEGADEIPAAVMADSELSEHFEVELAETVPEFDSVEEPTVDAPEFEGPTAELSLDALGDIDVGEIGGAGDLAAESGGGALAGGAGSAQFFGVEARGSRFAFIVDVSGSMDEQRLGALKRALAESIADLPEHAHFSIVAYSNEATPVTGLGWLSATPANKNESKRRVAAMQAWGGTVPVPAFDVVFEMKPPPDAIYFMTDGVFGFDQSRDILRRINQMNNRAASRVPIHCITFVERDAEVIMKRIARHSGGSYTHVEGATP